MPKRRSAAQKSAIRKLIALNRSRARKVHSCHRKKSSKSASRRASKSKSRSRSRSRSRR